MPESGGQREAGDVGDGVILHFIPHGIEEHDAADAR